MIFTQISSGLELFVDSNTLVDYFAAHPVNGPTCKVLFERIERQDVRGFSAAHILAEVSHRLMTIEACTLFGWPARQIVQRLRNHPQEIGKLSLFRRALDEVTLIGLEVLAVTKPAVSLAADVSRQFGLLTNDALTIALMRDQGLTHLASHDSDFDRVAGITRYAPV